MIALMDYEQQGGAPPDFKNTRRQKAKPDSQSDRLPPHDILAEQAVLGCALLSPQETIPLCVEKLGTPDAFYDLRNRSIYEVMLAMYDERIPIDVVSLRSELSDRLQLEAVGGVGYIAGLPDTASSPSNIGHYVEIVLEKHALRRVISTCTEVASRAQEHQGEIDALLDEVERDVLKIAGDRQSSELVSSSELIPKTVALIESLYERQGGLGGLSTGFPDFDAMSGGLRDGEMIVIAARPSVGKSAISMNIADHVAVDLDLPVGIFSLEMTATSLMFRAVCSRARINPRNISDRQLFSADFQRITFATSKLMAAKIYVDDSAGLSIAQLRARARRMWQRHNVRLMVVDYMQLLRGSGKRSESREQEVSEISNGIKGIAKELSIPVIAVCQLNREVNKRGGKPMMSDIRQSGQIEADADIIALLYNPKPDDDEEGVEPYAPAFACPVNVILAKNRTGMTGEFPLVFLKGFTRFESAAKISNEDASI